MELFSLGVGAGAIFVFAFYVIQTTLEEKRKKKIQTDDYFCRRKLREINEDISLVKRNLPEKCKNAEPMLDDIKDDIRVIITMIEE